MTTLQYDRREHTPSARSLAAGCVIAQLTDEGWSVRSLRSGAARAHFALDARRQMRDARGREVRVVVHGFHSTEVQLDDIWSLVAAKNDIRADAAVLAVSGSYTLSHLAEATARSLDVELLVIA